MCVFFRLEGDRAEFIVAPPLAHCIVQEKREGIVECLATTDASPLLIQQVGSLDWNEYISS